MGNEGIEGCSSERESEREDGGEEDLVSSKDEGRGRILGSSLEEVGVAEEEEEESGGKGMY